MDTTADDLPDSFPPTLAEGMRLAQEDPAGLPGWLAAHPELAGGLARFLAAEGDVQSLLDGGRADQPGAVIGGYELREEIGRGGMGVVYKAWDPTLRTEVAVKRMLSGTFHSAEERAWFRFEAESAAALRHPNIVPVYVLGEAGGSPYLVMPLMEGGSLAAWLKALGPDRRRPPRQAARMVLDLARAVQHAHDHGLLHRDLKPANVLLDKGRRPHVADFGLARPLDLPVSGIAGTAAYMAPEQARGEKRLTTAVDVHALGAILYELLTGVPPFGTGELARVLRAVADEPAPPVRRLRPDVPRDLERICLKCLEKDPAARYPSAAALADDLDRFLNYLPVITLPVGVLGEIARAVRWRRESPSLMTWRALIPGAINHAAFHGTVAAPVFAGAPTGWPAGVLVVHLASWAAFVWWYAIRCKDALSAVERGATAIMVGMVLATATVLWVRLPVPEPNVPELYPFYNVVIGLGTFAYGAVHWGRHYLVGLAWMAQNLVLPFLPPWAGPALHALVGAAIQLWMGLRLWQLDRAARAEPPS